MAKLFLSALLLVLYHATAQAYKVAVVEYYPVANPNTTEDHTDMMLKNLNEFRSHAEAASNQEATLVVFPEYGLTTIVDNPEDFAIEINENEQIIKELKAIAIEKSIFIVVNLIEKLQDSSKSTKYFNTNLVFDTNGNIVHKYRKINLNSKNDKKITAGEPNQALTFTSDFSVTFGLFTSDDILYDNPSRRVLDNTEVIDIIYPTAWRNSLPFFSALSVQHGYSLAYGVNLLAADYGKPAASIGGSGIYLSSGKSAELYLSDSPSSKRLVQDIPKILKREDRTVCSSIAPQGLPGPLGKNNVTNYPVLRAFKSSDFKGKDVDLTQKESKYDICYDDFCCHFDIVLNTTSVSSSDFYKVVAFQGSITLDDTKHNVRICSLLACEDSSIDSCGNKRDSISTKFTKITVKGDVKVEDETFYVPSTLDTYLLPIRDTSFCNTKNATNSTYVQLTTIRSQDNVIAFGLIGKTSSAASIQAFGFFFLAVLAKLIAL